MQIIQHPKNGEKGFLLQEYSIHMPSYSEIIILHILWIVISISVTYPFFRLGNGKNTALGCLSIYFAILLSLITSGLFVEAITQELKLDIGGRIFYVFLYLGLLIFIKHIAVNEKTADTEMKVEPTLLDDSIRRHRIFIFSLLFFILAAIMQIQAAHMGFKGVPLLSRLNYSLSFMFLIWALFKFKNRSDSEKPTICLTDEMILFQENCNRLIGDSITEVNYLQTDDVVTGRVDNICVTDNEELARRVKMIF